MSKMRALGTALYCLPTYDDVGAITEVGALSSIGEISLDSDELDVTTLDSTGGYREFLQGFKDSGEVTLAGFHDSTEAGQGAMRTLYGSAATNYFWIMFPDRTVVAFTAYVKGYTAGAFEVDGAVGFGATLRVTGSVQVFAIKPAVAQSKTAGQTATMDSTTKVAVGTPVYQWYSNATNDYVTPDIIAGQTNATYTTAALAAGTYYYMCLVSSTNHRPTYSQIHVITVAP
jgi:predicted secreted protein